MPAAGGDRLRPIFPAPRFAPPTRPLLSEPPRYSPAVLELNAAIKRQNKLRLLGSMVAAPLLLFVALFSAPSALPPAARRIGGALLLLSGLSLRLLALGAIDGVKKQVLVNWGPYRFVRHPLYTGSLLMLTAFFVHAGSLTATLLGIALFLALYLPTVRLEERFLAERFRDEWPAHRARTWALVPRPHRHRGPAAPPFRLRRPGREIFDLLVLALVIAGGAEWVARLRELYGLPGWFF